jgi:hypothetical protein
MSSPSARDARTVLIVSAAISAVALTTAVAVRVTCAAAMRDTLAFPFTGVAPRLSEAGAIFANNARLMGAVFALAIVVQSPWLDDSVTQPRRHPVLVRFCDTLLMLVAGANVLFVGAALGAYGQRMARAMLPHRPVELAAFAVALTLYLDARRGPLRVRRAVTLVALSLVVLALAALLETYITL